MKRKTPVRDLLKRLNEKTRWLNVPAWLRGAGNALLILIVVVIALAVLA